MFREIKEPKHSITYLLVKVAHSQNDLMAYLPISASLQQNY